MEIYSAQKNNVITFIIIATSLCNRYEEWKLDKNIMDIVDVNNNTICKGLIKLYPNIEHKILQSIALAFTMYFLIDSENSDESMKSLMFTKNYEVD